MNIIKKELKMSEEQNVVNETKKTERWLVILTNLD